MIDQTRLIFNFQLSGNQTEHFTISIFYLRLASTTATLSEKALLRQKSVKGGHIHKTGTFPTLFICYYVNPFIVPSKVEILPHTPLKKRKKKKKKVKM